MTTETPELATIAREIETELLAARQTGDLNSKWHPLLERLSSALARRSAASAEPAVAVKPAKLQIGVDAYKAENAKHGWTGRGYSLDPFFLNLNRDGGASVGFAEKDANYERDDETGRAYIFCNSPVSEVLELRDYLNEAFPLATPPPSPVASEEK